jgi:hypothetical protein
MAFSDQMADKFYQQNIEMENYNIRLGSDSKDPPGTVVDNVHHHNYLKLSLFDPSDLHVNNDNGKPAHLVFHGDSIQKTNVEYSIWVKTDPHFSKALPSKIDYERLSPLRPRDVIQHTQRQTTPLDKSTIHYIMRRYLKT